MHADRPFARYPILIGDVLAEAQQAEVPDNASLEKLTLFGLELDNRVILGA